jgi:CBS domain-containing membrane protein
MKSPTSALHCERFRTAQSALLGHAIGLLCGYVSLWLVGLEDAPSAMLEGVNGPRVVAAALSLASTGALMIFLQVIHPPAGATTLIVSLGIVTDPFFTCLSSSSRWR